LPSPNARDAESKRPAAWRGFGYPKWSGTEAVGISQHESYLCPITDDYPAGHHGMADAQTGPCLPHCQPCGNGQDQKQDSDPL
jgi:hypothetical protein